MLLPPPGVDQWDEYKALEAVVRGRPRLLRLITKPMYGPTEAVPEFNGLVHGVVLSAIERYQALHDTDEGEFPELIEELTDWFCRDADPMFVAVSLIGFTASEPLTLSQGITVRRATDIEVSAMLQLGALNVGSNPTPTEVYSTHVPEAAQWVVAMDHSRPRGFGLDVQDEDEPDLLTLKEKADDWLAVLRILTSTQVRLGSLLKTQIVTGMAVGGSVDRSGASALFAWHNPATITSDNVATFEALAQKIVGGTKKLNFGHGLRRFSEATTRSSVADRHVDLVIALESMFSDGGDSIRYKVSRRASAMMGPIGLPAGVIFQFVKDAYACRNAIVHGGEVPTFRSLTREICTPEEEVRVLDRLVAAAFRHVLSGSSSAKPDVTADEVISAALDSYNRPETAEDRPEAAEEPERYFVTVGRDGRDFRAVLPVDNTFLVRSLTLEQLHSQLANCVALWTQAPCQVDQIELELDDDARAASSKKG